MFMRFGAILDLVKILSNQVLKYANLSTFSKLKFSSRFGYPYERLAWTPIFMRFGATLALDKGG